MGRRFVYENDVNKAANQVILQYLHKAEQEVQNLRIENANLKKKIPQIETIETIDEEMS